MPLIRRFAAPLALMAALGLASAQPARAQSTPEAGPAPRAEDVATLDGIMTAIYDVISGPAGQDRNWDRMRSLFVPGARLIPTGRRPDGTVGHRVWSVEDYVTTAGPGLVRDGFFEREIGRVTERFGNIVHLMSAYEARRTAADPAPFLRGVNSFQLLWDGARWWVVTIYWQSETADTPIPDRFLRKQ